MRNMGTKTIHSCGPHSYKKDKYGMIDKRACYEKKFKETVEKVFSNLDWVFFFFANLDLFIFR